MLRSLPETAEPTELANCPAPAKLNLFLHVIGRRADGYHSIESLFQLIDLSDMLHFKLRHDSKILRVGSVPGVPAESDLTVRAARLLQARSGSRFGVEIHLEKRIPIGAGLGGGSSDAATTLLALNRLWRLRIRRTELMNLALELGADVPFFVSGKNAFVSGIGEEIHPLEGTSSLGPLFFMVIHPGVSVPTEAIFGAPELTRNSESLKIARFSDETQALISQVLVSACDLPESRFDDSARGRFRNDLEAVAVARYPAVGEALSWLRQRAGTFDGGRARMSGSGASVFCRVENPDTGRRVLDDLPAGWSGWVCKGLAEHPLLGFAED